MRSDRSALWNKPISAGVRNEPLKAPLVQAQRRIRNGCRSVERTEAASELEPIKQTIRGIVCQAEQRAVEMRGFRSDVGQTDPHGGGQGKLLSPARRRSCISHVRTQLNHSERRACRVLGQHRSTQRRVPQGRADEDRLVADMIGLTRQYGRYAYRRIAALLREAGWSVSDGRVERLRRREGLKVPVKQPKKARLWLNPLGTLLCNALPGSGWLVCSAEAGVSQSCMEP